MVAIKAHTHTHIFSHSSSSHLCLPACLPSVISLHSLWPFFGISDFVFERERLRLCGDFHINLIICTDEWIQCTAYTLHYTHSVAHWYREINQMICVVLLMPMPTKYKRAYTHSSLCFSYSCYITSNVGEKQREMVVRVGA